MSFHEIGWLAGRAATELRSAGARHTTAAPGAKPFHVEIDDRSRIKGQHLAHDEPADDGDAERLPQFRTVAMTERERHGPEQSRHGRHQDRTETQHAGAKDRILGRNAGLAAFGNREVDHEDRVFLHNADEQNDADQGDDGEVRVRDPSSARIAPPPADGRVEMMVSG